MNSHLVILIDVTEMRIPSEINPTLPLCNVTFRGLAGGFGCKQNHDSKLWLFWVTSLVLCESMPLFNFHLFLLIIGTYFDRWSPTVCLLNRTVYFYFAWQICNSLSIWLEGSLVLSKKLNNLSVFRQNTFNKVGTKY